MPYFLRLCVQGLIDKSEWDYSESASLSGRSKTGEVHTM